MLTIDDVTCRLAFSDPPATDALRLRIGPADRHRAIGYETLARRVLAAAEALHRRGLTPGDRVGLLLPQGEDLPVWFFGAIHGGYVPCILPWPTAKMDDDKYARSLTAGLERLDLATLVRDEAVPSHRGAAPPPRVRREGTLFIQFTGGTTGTQEPVPVTAAMLTAQLAGYARAIDLRPSDAVASWLPLYHDMGLIACLLLPIIHRLPVTMLDPMEWVMRPASLLEAIHADRATLCWLPNFAHAFMARKVGVIDVDLSCLRAVINCSEPVRPRSVDAFSNRFRHHGLTSEALLTSYAMAEATFAVTQTTADDPPRRRDARLSCGRPIDGIELRIVDGEIHVAGEAVIGDGWYATGDMGELVDGHLYVSGRKRDLIIVGGVNVFPEDVEDAATVEGVHPGRVVAFGLVDQELGTERLCVVAESERHESCAERIKAMIRRAVTAACQVAPQVVVVPPRWIVKSTAGKPSRSDTRRRYLERLTPPRVSP